MTSTLEPSSSETSGRRRPVLLVLLVFIGVPFLLGLMWALSFRQSGVSAVSRLEASIRAKGEPVTLVELAATYPAIPDTNNGAVALLQIWEEDAPAFWQAFRNGERNLPARPDIRYDGDLPFLGSDASYIGRLEDLQPTNLAAAKAYLEANKEHLDAVRAALRFPQFRFPVQITNGFLALLPHLAELKKEAMNFRIEALLASERGEADAAIDALENAARAGKTMTLEPTVISQLVRAACYNMVLEDLQRLLSRHSLSSSQLLRVEALLDQLQTDGALRLALIGERACDLSAFDLPLETLTGATGGSDQDSVSRTASGVAIGLFNVLGLKAADQRLLLETLTEAVALAGTNDPDALERFGELIRETSAKARQFPPKVLTAMLLPALDKTAVRFASLEGRRRSAVVAVAVERFRMAHNGRLPASLGELVPQFLKEIPTDPFSGSPLHFLPLTNGFVVYSIGPNGVDDGGQEKPRKNTAKSFDETFIIER